MNASQPTGEPVDAPPPGRTLADAAKELRALLQAQRDRQRAARGPNADLVDELARLKRKAARSRAAAAAFYGDSPMDTVDEPGGAP